MAVDKPAHQPEVAGSEVRAPAKPRRAVARTRSSSKAAAIRAGMPAHDGRVRAVVDAVLPNVDGGRFAAKAVAGEPFDVTAHAFTDGHDVPRVMLRWHADDDAGVSPAVHEVEMRADHNDVWHASFVPPALGRYRYTVLAWVDAFRSWRRDLERRVEAEDIRIAVLVGAELLDAAAARAGTKHRADKKALKDWGARLRKAAQSSPHPALSQGERVQGAAQARSPNPLPRLEEGANPTSDAQSLKPLALDLALAELADRHPDRSLATTFAIELPLVAERERAGFSTWYELFPRSAADEPGRHGTFKDVQARLPYVASMGFDVLYLPPIHPIGRVQRKGKNNALVAQEDDVGSPWAIGAAEGGHKAILPELGTAEDFRALVQAARAHGIEIALDIAFQCAPDHPYVEAHPQWFRRRPDGSVQYAENPPKKYQDIYPFNFETEDWRALWQELKSVFEHWIGQGIAIFRVDNPHTKSFAFWQWAIDELKREHPETIFLAEAFTRPKVMHRLAKLGYSQSYTYFTWRNNKHELTEYFTELAHGLGAAYFRPNVWPNTPDILNEHLHGGGRAVFGLRLVLAATLSANYGLYGPAYELMENRPREPGSEEYLDSEKYQLRQWDLSRADSLAPLIARINKIRREHPALQSNDTLAFQSIDNDQLIAYTKRSRDGSDTILTIVNLDPHNPQSGWLQLDGAALGLDHGDEYQVHDLLGEQRFIWQGLSNFIILDPAHAPAHVFLLRRRVMREQDFDYFV